MYWLIIVVVFAAILAASYTDIRTREVADWVNYAFIASALGIRSVMSIVQQDWHSIVYGLLGFGAMYLLALLMFNTGQWGGGDSKLLMGIGAAIGIEFAWPSLLLYFIFALAIMGALYGMLWSIFLMIKNWNKFKTDFTKLMNTKSYTLARKITLAIMMLLFITMLFVNDYIINIGIFTFIILLFLSYLLITAAKAIETSCMHKSVSPEKLTEGDWIVKDIKINGKYICGPKDLGIEKSQIKKLIQLKKQKKISKVLIKEGIPFVPSFLLAFIVLIFLEKILSFLGLAF